MLKLLNGQWKEETISQPPSGGCVLKLLERMRKYHSNSPAAFRRLCVETDAFELKNLIDKDQPPSGGCVLKQMKPYT